MPADRPLAEPGVLHLDAIGVVPLGQLAPRRVDEVVRRLSRRVGVPCRQLPGIDAEALPRLPHRPQLNADGVLSLLERQVARPGQVLLGLTAEDLGHPLFTFFFGRARMGGSALVSAHRLDPAYYGLPRDDDLVLQRIVIECLHELGHVAGLHHCDLHECVMHFSGSVEMIDLRGRGFCGGCTSTLPLPLRHALHG